MLWLCWKKMLCSKTNHNMHFFKEHRFMELWKWNKTQTEEEIELSFILFSCTLCAFPNIQVFFCCLHPVLCFEFEHFCWPFEESSKENLPAECTVPHTQTPCNNVLLQFSHSKAPLCFHHVEQLIQRRSLLCWAIGTEQNCTQTCSYFPSTGNVLLDLYRLFLYIP